MHPDILYEAMRLALQAHMGVKDKGGEPYILHPLHVMNAVKIHGVKYMVTALLHDVVEDSEYTLETLSDCGFHISIIEAVGFLTHKVGDKYMYYISKIPNNKMALEVKKEDLLHNMDLSRLGEIGPSDILRIEKYHQAYKYLLNYV